MRFTKVEGALMPVSPDDQVWFAEIGENVEFECFLVKKDKKRNLKQNSALYKYFDLIAVALNNAGLDMKKVLKEETEIPWNKDSVKKYLFAPVQAAMQKGDSTTELTTVTVSEVYDVLSRHLSSKFGVNVPFPSLRG